MSATAFSPSGKYAAFVSESGSVTVLNTETGQRLSNDLVQLETYSEPSLAWSTNEITFYYANLHNGRRLKLTILPFGPFIAEAFGQTNPPDLLTCYGRISNGRWSGGDDWGAVFNTDSCGDYEAFTEPGLGSRLAIYR